MVGAIKDSVVPEPSETESPDRRRFRRVAMPVFFRVPRIRNVRTPVVDVAQGGLRIYSDDEMEVGSMLELELFLPAGDEVRALARVAWVSELPSDAAAKYDIGFELVDMSPSSRALLNEAIESAE